MVSILLVGLKGSGCRTAADHLSRAFGFSIYIIDPVTLPVDKLRQLLTQHHDKHHVILGIRNAQDLLTLRSRSFVLSIAIEAPISERAERLGRTIDYIVNEDEKLLYNSGSLAKCFALADIHIYNKGNKEDFLNELTQLKPNSTLIFRPNFDELFMNCAKVISSRSNCLRRAVGAVLINNYVVISTGYNGTPTKTLDCLDGGCLRCSDIGQTRAIGLCSCLCVHAEANALLQAGMSRSEGGILYVTCCPCLSCAKLIIQARIKKIIYLDEYNSDPLVNELLNQAGISLIKHKKRLMKRFDI